MKNLLHFLIEIGKLKKMPRTGFVWLGIKNPETIAQHTFRVAIMNWILGRKTTPGLNLRKVIKISLVHDLCEVYAGDMTPYWGLLPKDKKKRKEILKRWIRLPKKIKEKRDREKLKKEKKSLQKLIKHLEPNLKKEIMNCWLEYERLYSKEGRFVKQGDKVETLLEALEYWGPEPDSPVVGWWEEVEDLVDNSILLKFLGKIEKKFYKGKKVDGKLKFLLEIGKLKTMPRTGWVLRKVKNPETIAEHSFLLAMASWILGYGKKMSLEKILKMSLIYEICEVYAGDATPYDELLSKRKRKEILKRWPRFLKREKKKRFLEDYKKEKEALEKLTSVLPAELKKEIIGLWDECKKRKTLEGRFVSQVYWLVTYLQALQYFKENKKFPILAWYEQMREFIEDLDLLRLMEEMEKKFLPKNIKL
jgi:5'-deoxynucleotidase YfbR-like HD superfamily hydrolase